MSARSTPVMQQHAAAKAAHPDAVIFFRLGDFYEMFGDDAVLAAKLLDLTLTSRNRGKPDEVPMAGVPHHAAHGYVARLLALGHKVAICEQLADPALVRGIVPRAVVRVITPGLVTEAEHLDSGSNNFLGAVEVASDGIGLALLDLSTGELRAAELDSVTTLLAELSRAAPRELLLGSPPAELEALRTAVSAACRAALRVDPELPAAELPAALTDLASDALALPSVAARAAGRALRFARACNPGVALPVRRIVRWEPSTLLAIDPTAQAHLEIVSSVSGTRAATLLGVIDATETPMGARVLKRRLLAPLTDLERIRRRLDMVEAFVVHPRLREQVKSGLREIGDLERLAVRAALGEATPRDLGALRDGLGATERVVAVLAEIADPGLRDALALGEEPIDVAPEVHELLSRALVERPPAQLKEGGVFRAGFDSELDELAELRQNGAERIVELEARLKRETAISTLKLRFTRVFGWYIEVSRAQSARVPEQFRRKQTVATGERYTTPELEELADRILHAEERQRSRELALAAELVARVAREAERIRSLAARLARWDVAVALAEVAHRYDYARPTVDDSESIVIRDGRHPVVERLAERGRFVPNDVNLELGGERLWLVTGPNMAGKSTLLRQVALCVVLAQMGSYVPARAARIGLVDRVLSRVGASDNLAQGESTFMVEMRETAQILRSATRRSLLIVDEIGRGTSTFDGLAIAWAVAEYIDDAIGCRALFATHYHELTALAESSRHVANYSVSARELEGDVVFLHRLVPGPASRSYGVAVARLAGLPEAVLARARALLASLESQAPGLSTELPERARQRDAQLGLFGAASPLARAESEVLGTLRALDLDRLSGLEALQLLARLKRQL